MTLSHGTGSRNKRSTEYDPRQQFSQPPAGVTGAAPPWRRPATKIGRGGRATATPGPESGSFISPNRELLHEKRELSHGEQEVFARFWARFRFVLRRERTKRPVSGRTSDPSSVAQS